MAFSDQLSYIGCISTGAYFLERTITSISDNDPSPWLTTQNLLYWCDREIKNGSHELFTIPAWQLPVLSSVLVANLPQLVITITHFFYNGILANMLVGREYSSHGSTRKALRVSVPVETSEQRSTYWLSVPFRYAILIIALETIFHLLVSKSFYYISIFPFDTFNEVMDVYVGKSLAYSPLFIFRSLLMGGLLLCILLVLSLRRLSSEMPLARSSSAVISAACHPPQHEDAEISVLGKLMWGETAPPA